MTPLYSPKSISLQHKSCYNKQMLGEYLSSDIETNLKSGSPFINALSVLDRRVGKRRLQKIADRGSSVAPMWAWPFYEARFEAEGIKCAWNFSL